MFGFSNSPQMAKSWDHLLFSEHSLIASSPLSELECFDVFMQKDSPWYHLGRGPIVSRVGSMVSLARDDVQAWQAYKQKIETKSLEAFTLGRALQKVGDIQHTVQPSSRFLTGIGLGSLSSAKAELSQNRSLVCKAVDVAKATVKPDFIENLVNGRTPVWKPDTTRKELHWPAAGSDRKTIHFWVVTEVQYAQKIIVGQRASLGIFAQVQGEIAGTGGGSGTFEISKDTKGCWIVTAASGSRVPFAFKATKLVYNSAGELAAIDAYVRRQVDRRAGDDAEVFNPDRDPNFHMRELFYPGPGSQESAASEDIELECLVESVTAEGE